MNLYNNYYQIIPCILITTGRLYWNTLVWIVKHVTINGSIIVRNISIQDSVPVLQTAVLFVKLFNTLIPFLSKTLQSEIDALHLQVALNMSPGDMYTITSVLGHEEFVPCLNIVPAKVYIIIVVICLIYF